MRPSPRSINVLLGILQPPPGRERDRRTLTSMTGRQEQRRVLVHIDGTPYALGDRDLVDLMTAIEAAVSTPGAFVDLTHGDRLVSVLITPTSRVVITVDLDAPTDPDSFFPTSPITDWEM